MSYAFEYSILLGGFFQLEAMPCVNDQRDAQLL